MMTDSIGLMLRSPPCPKGEVGVSKHEAAHSFETPALRRAPQDEGGAALQSPQAPAQKNASVRISMLSRGLASGGEVGSSNAVWAVQRARPSLSES